MDFNKPSYIFGILTDNSVSREDVLSVKVADLLQFKEQCEHNGRFLSHPYYIPMDEACRFLNVSKYTLYEWLRTGKVHGRKFGRKWQIREIDLM